jgi:hypothetical protein
MQPCERTRVQQASKVPSGRTLFFKVTSPQQSYADALLQDKQYPQAAQIEQQYLPQKISENSSVSTDSQFV